MRPCTVHYVVSSDDTIVFGHHFYSASTITRFISEIVHTFMTGNFVTNDLLSKMHTLIRRLLYFWLKYYTVEDRNRNKFKLKLLIHSYCV